MDLQGYSAWISVDGATLKEYNVEVSNGKSATCWIASEAGKRFTVNWRDSNRSSMISGLVKLDGIPCGGHTVSPALPGMPLMPVTVQKSTVPTSIMTEKPFLFSPLELTDDDSFLDQHVAVNNLGEISIEIWKVSMVAAASPLHAITFPEDQKVHERSKKALAHCVKLGEDIFAPQQQRVRVQQTDVAPLVTFTFKYRSFEMLKANGIVPTAAGNKRSAATQSAAEDVKPEIIEIEDDAEEIKALEARLNNLKSRRSNSKGNPSKRVKREPANQSSFVPGEVIDLT
ncbi:hypothetical protein PILCRDRAFT_822544 [Piloderma croceum F 1598]|uniref:DUF7918 domain-containing protein n=1 Tax=Piloderma croceum (strain F 1598) TaxID=765440 RepID=A0A0C3F6W0_PILCF|nr:hypothetical protein PILCRDRAFT_822544 [Piloderma croceum F 1598]